MKFDWRSFGWDAPLSSHSNWTLEPETSLSDGNSDSIRPQLFIFKLLFKADL
jgi:hypothetical protein